MLVAPFAMMAMVTTVHSQTAACDQLKATLAARIEATGVRGYGMEAVAANVPVPSGAKVIGTCESGAFKIVYRRWAVAQPPSDGTNAAPAPAAAAASRAALRRVEPAPAAVPPAEPRAPPPKVSASPGLAVEAASSAAPPPRPAAMTSAMTPAVAPAPIAPVALQSARTESPAASEATVSAPVPVPAVSIATRTSVPWLGGLAALLAIAIVWLWRRHFSAYDKDGLPRGPRL